MIITATNAPIMNWKARVVVKSTNLYVKDGELVVNVRLDNIPNRDGHHVEVVPQEKYQVLVPEGVRIAILDTRPKHRSSPAQHVQQANLQLQKVLPSVRIVMLDKYQAAQPVSAQIAMLDTRPQHHSNCVLHVLRVNTPQRRAHKLVHIATTANSKLLMHKPGAAHALSASTHQTTQIVLTPHAPAVTTGTSKSNKDRVAVRNVLSESIHQTTVVHTHNAIIVTPGFTRIQRNLVLVTPAFLVHTHQTTVVPTRNAITAITDSTKVQVGNPRVSNVPLGSTQPLRIIQILFASAAM